MCGRCVPLPTRGTNMEPVQKRVQLAGADPVDVNKCVLNLDGYSYMIGEGAGFMGRADGSG